MKPLSRPVQLGLFATLLATMVATRFNHFGDVLHLPDASMALFFLGGLYLRRHWQFGVMMVLAVLVDWVSIEHAGVSDFCITPSYAFLLPAYAVLWYGGRLYSGQLQSTWGSLALAVLVGLASASLSFVISNGAFYWFGGRYAEPHFAEYLARLWQWGPLFLRTTIAYIAVAALVHRGLAWSRRSDLVHV